MWINKIVNVVVENKKKKTFYEKSLWAHHDMNIVIQFATCYAWGAVELTSEQYESIEATSGRTDTYDTQYNSPSHHDIKNFEKMLFSFDKTFVGTEFCKIWRQSGKYSIPDMNTLKAMSDLSWFELNYGTVTADISKLYDALEKNGWTFLENSFAIDGEIEVNKKDEYDYLWGADGNANSAEGVRDKELYSLRLSFLNSRKEY